MQNKILHHFHNIFRLFKVLPNFSLTASETMHNYYLQTSYIELPQDLPNDLRLRISGNWEILGMCL